MSEFWILGLKYFFAYFGWTMALPAAGQINCGMADEPLFDSLNKPWWAIPYSTQILPITLIQGLSDLSTYLVTGYTVLIAFATAAASIPSPKTLLFPSSIFVTFLFGLFWMSRVYSGNINASVGLSWGITGLYGLLFGYAGFGMYSSLASGIFSNPSFPSTLLLGILFVSSIYVSALITSMANLNPGR